MTLSNLQVKIISVSLNWKHGLGVSISTHIAGCWSLAGAPNAISLDITSLGLGITPASTVS